MAVLLACSATSSAAATEDVARAGDRLLNPSFEMDADKDGRPDGWDIHKLAKGRLVGEATQGGRAVEFTDGYVVLAQNFAIDDLAGKTVTFCIDARSGDGAKLGVLLGFMHVNKKGKKTWRNARMCWDRPLSTDYAAVRLQRTVPAGVVGTRLWLGIYRSNRTGVLTLDNARLSVTRLTPERQVRLNRVEREWRYLRERAQSVGKRVDVAQVLAAARQVEDRCLAADVSVLKEAELLARELGVQSARLNRRVCAGRRLSVSLADAHRRLAPTDLPPAAPVLETRRTALAGEHQAVGVVVANGADTPVALPVTVAGLPAEGFTCEVRRQAYLETWYQKENTRVADPLPLLPKEDGVCRLTLQPGEIAKLYVSVHCLRAPSQAKAVVRIGREAALTLSLNVLPLPKGGLPEFGHLSCIYTNKSVAARSPERTAADLGAHAVTAMEFAFPPKCVFGPDGKLLKADFSRQDLWMKAYGPHVDRMAIYYAPSYDELTLADGTAIKPYTPAWDQAFVSLIGALLERAKGLGYGMDRFALWTVDEPHSAHLSASPDERIANALHVMKLTRRAFPKLKQLITLTYYAFPRDVAALAPYIDIAVPHWPTPARLKKSAAPPSYNPRQAYAKEIGPMLEAERKKRGMRIWSYHVAAGKTDDELRYNRAYPIRAVGAGWRGVGHWAYNVARGSTWDDTDGGGVDYVFVYDGKEDHPVNRRLNPTGEAIVPSIRWKAVRAGIQDARILLHLKDTRHPGAARLLERVQALATDDSLITWQAVTEISREARRLYADRRPARARDHGGAVSGTHPRQAPTLEPKGSRREKP